MELFPSICYLFKEAVDLKLSDVFFDRLCDNIGCVFTKKSIASLPEELLKKIRSKYPSLYGYYYKFDDVLSFDDFDFVVVSNDDFLNFSKLKYPAKKVLVSFDLDVSNKTFINSYLIIKQLKKYFLFSGKNPQYNCAVYCNISMIDNLPEFFLLMAKLGLKIFITPYCETTDKGNNFLKIKAQSEKINSLPDKSKVSQLENLRKKVDLLDKILIETITKRKVLINEMGEIKNQNKLQLYDSIRWNKILKSRKFFGKENMLDEDLIEKIFEAIHLDNLKSML